MNVKEIKGWTKLNSDFGKWYGANGSPSWVRQRNWLSKELIKRGFIDEEQLPEMWVLFTSLTDGCSTWKVQSKILNIIVLCLDKDIGEDLDKYIK